MLKHNVLDGIIWKTGSQCLSTGVTKESSVKHWNTSQGHWNDTLYTPTMDYPTKKGIEIEGFFDCIE